MWRLTHVLAHDLLAHVHYELLYMKEQKLLICLVYSQMYEQFWHPGLQSGKHFLSSHTVGDLSEVLSALPEKRDAWKIGKHGTEYTYQVLLLLFAWCLSVCVCLVSSSVF